jgi:4-hydroxybenzoate polyprenyltransferase
LFPELGNSNDTAFYFITITSILIAAAGYIINDYFDVNIDQVNKPAKVLVGEHISRRWVIFWHLILSLLGIYLLTIAFPFKDFWLIHVGNITCILLLWFYSTNFKKNFLVGNVVIALLTAWSIAIVYFSKFTATELLHPKVHDIAHVRFFKLMLLYSAFAFILTLIREALKDMEDMEGDEKFGCRTLPIVWGLKPTKVYLAVWLLVVIVALSIIQVFVLPYGWWISVLYCIVFIILPLTYVLFKLSKSFTHTDFAILSFWIKVSMLAGIVSMAFFYFLF